MFSPDQMDVILQEALAKLGIQDDYDQKGDKKKETKKGCKGLNLTTSQILVIAGLLGGVFAVDSILIDKDQTIQIVLEGSLKKKTQLEKMMDQIGQKSFDEVMKALLGRF